MLPSTSYPISHTPYKQALDAYVPPERMPEHFQHSYRAIICVAHDTLNVAGSKSNHYKILPLKKRIISKQQVRVASILNQLEHPILKGKINTNLPLETLNFYFVEIKKAFNKMEALRV